MEIDGIHGAFFNATVPVSWRFQNESYITFGIALFVAVLGLALVANHSTAVAGEPCAPAACAPAACASRLRSGILRAGVVLPAARAPLPRTAFLPSAFLPSRFVRAGRLLRSGALRLRLLVLLRHPAPLRRLVPRPVRPLAPRRPASR